LGRPRRVVQLVEKKEKGRRGPRRARPAWSTWPSGHAAHEASSSSRPCSRADRRKGQGRAEAHLGGGGRRRRLGTASVGRGGAGEGSAPPSRPAATSAGGGILAASPGKATVAAVPVTWRATEVVVRARRGRGSPWRREERAGTSGASSAWLANPHGDHGMPW
jgi:hypothetical protein